MAQQSSNETERERLVALMDTIRIEDINQKAQMDKERREIRFVFPIFA